MLLLGRKSAIERLASFFLSLSEYCEEHGENPARLYLPMMRNDIGDYLGMTTETVSRSLGELKRLGIIRVPSPAHVILQDFERLMDLAEDGGGLGSCWNRLADNRTRGSDQGFAARPKVDRLAQTMRGLTARNAS